MKTTRWKNYLVQIVKALLSYDYDSVLDYERSTEVSDTTTITIGHGTTITGP